MCPVFDDLFAKTLVYNPENDIVFTILRTDLERWRCPYIHLKMYSPKFTSMPQGRSTLSMICSCPRTTGELLSRYRTRRRAVHFDGQRRPDSKDALFIHQFSRRFLGLVADRDGTASASPGTAFFNQSFFFFLCPLSNSILVFDKRYTRSFCFTLQFICGINDIHSFIAPWSVTLACKLLCRALYYTYGRDVCLSVTRWHCVKTTQARITTTSPADNTRTALRKLERVHLELRR